MPTLIALDDRRYAAWLTDHPDGFVANINARRSPDYFVVHRSRCHTITPGSSRNNDHGAFTHRQVQKVVSADLAELVAWGRQHGFNDYGVRPCNICLSGQPLPRCPPVAYADEVLVDPGLIREGAVRRVEVNAYERSARARQACIEHHGTGCAVCGLEFGDVYPGLGDGFIHVHHLVELAELDGETAVDPVADLRPVCPNCHAMLHRSRPAMSIEALRELVQRGSGGWAAPPVEHDRWEALSALVERARTAEAVRRDSPYSDGGVVMLFERLVRAAHNQLSGGTSTGSRYGIWANTGRDHIRAALDHLERGETDEAQQLLVQVANALDAFAAIQGLVEGRER